MASMLDPISRIIHPEASSGNSPSFSPPDTRYAPGLRTARGLGWYSIGLGLAEVLAPRMMSDLTGVRNLGLLQLYGVREITCGIGILNSNRPAGWLWARVAGDALDLVTLGAAMSNGNGDTQRALGASAAVGGVALLDLECAAQLSAAAAVEG